LRLFAGTSEEFVRDTELNRIAGKLEDSFFQAYRFKPSPGEIQSWHNSLGRMADVLRVGKLDDHGVILEYQLPLTSSRLDFLICGESASGSAHAAIVELKQWSGTRSADGERLVSTVLGGAWVDTLHPSAQVRQYRGYLLDSHTAFYEGPEPIALSSCAFLHNYLPSPNDSLFEPRFTNLLVESPVFCRDDVPGLVRFLTANLAGGHGADVLRRVEQSRYRPSKKLLDHVRQVIKREPAYSLLDEQLVVYDRVMALARRSYQDAKKSIVIVRGGPGTGKSVIAMNLLADLAGEGLNAQYATGSRAFTETLRRIVGPKAGSQFKYFNGYGQAEPNVVDVLICDEAHRIRETSNSRFTRKSSRSDKPQIAELMNAAKTVVFFIDDEQGVRPNEIGSSKYIVEAVRDNAQVYEHELKAQFRCAGSDGFVNWISNTLEIEKTANTLWSGDPNFEFQILDSPEQLDKQIRSKADQGYSARLTAGFCWPWSDPLADGTLENDVRLGAFVRPWNAKPDSKKHLAPGIPQATLWAHDRRGIGQVGCVYTAQGFEFDYVGVIFGQDLRYESARGGWVGHPEHSYDSSVVRSKGGFTSLVKRAYRVLLSRGHKGCYVHFTDKETEHFFRSRLDTEVRRGSGSPGRPISIPTLAVEDEELTPFRVLPFNKVRPFENAVPLLDLEAAAGAFGPDRSLVVDIEDVSSWVELAQEFRPRPGLFVTRVVGESMNKRIPNGAWCLFRGSPSGTRQGKIVLAELQDVADPETGRFAVKVYQSDRRQREDGSWSHEEIRLEPDSTDHSFRPLVFGETNAHQLRIVAELVAVLS